MSPPLEHSLERQLKTKSSLIDHRFKLSTDYRDGNLESKPSGFFTSRCTVEGEAEDQLPIAVEEENTQENTQDENYINKEKQTLELPENVTGIELHKYSNESSRSRLRKEISRKPRPKKNEIDIKLLQKVKNTIS